MMTVLPRSSLFKLCVSFLSLASFFVAGNSCADTLLLRALDKTTGQVSVLPVAVGASTDFGSLRVHVHEAKRSPPEEREEIYAYLTIYDKSKTPEKVVFDTWMFGSSPALSALDHPLYDVWVDGYEADKS